jgi:hypothetical protein
MGVNTVAMLAVAMTACWASGAEKGKPVAMLFDTDIMGDVDDVGSVAMLHALADGGEIEILAMGVSGKNPYSPLCLDALNVYFGRPEIPIGVVRGPAFNKPSPYARQIAEEFPRRMQSADDAPDAALLYRRILAGRPDGETVLVSVGQLPNMQNLLKTQPDDHSPLDGVELVRRKIKVWVCMGAKFPSGYEANIHHDPKPAAYAIEHWPTTIIFSGWEIGNEIISGQGLTALPANSPVRRGYELYNKFKGRQSWDQTAVLYAGRGLDGGLGDYWGLSPNGRVEIDEKGNNVWRQTPDGQHIYLTKKKPPEEIAAELEKLMMHQPKNKR